MEEKLKRGVQVADVGCGHGVSTLFMAEAYPNSSFTGFDLHEGSIERAKELAQESGLDNIRFEVTSASDYEGSYDFVAFFDCLHDMGDPVGAMAHTREVLADDGTVLLVEPFAHDNLEDNLNPVGRVYYAASSALFVPSH